MATVSVMDGDDVRCVHVSVRQACNGCVSGSTPNALGGQNLEVWEVAAVDRPSL